jgi:GT2 family glycosyltransferase
MTGNHRSLSIVIPTWNGRELLERFLPGLFIALERHDAAHEVIIVDDASTDSSRAFLDDLARRRADVRVLHRDVNGGFAATANVGIFAARHEILFLLNNDVALAPDYFEHFSAHFDDSRVFAVTTYAVEEASGAPLDGLKTYAWTRGLPRMNRNIFNEQLGRSGVPPPWLSFAVHGGYFFADRMKTLALGGFDELFSPYIYEETDLSYRALKRGWEIRYEPLCASRHCHSATINRAVTPRRRLIIANRNRLWFVWKNYSGSFLLSHLFFLALKLLGGHRVYWPATLAALRRWREIGPRRRIERADAVVSDQALLERFTAYQRRFQERN